MIINTAITEAEKEGDRKRCKKKEKILMTIIDDKETGEGQTDDTHGSES